MATAYLVPCLAGLRDEFNRLGQHRDKRSDGWIGDAAHQATTSDHNPDAAGRVLAIDVDNTGPWPAAVTFDHIIDMIIGRCRSGREDRLEYVIWNGHIWSRSYGWVRRAYTGSSPHTEHAHFSARHDHHGESDRRGWNLLSLIAPEVPAVTMTSSDFNVTMPATYKTRRTMPTAWGWAIADLWSLADALKQSYTDTSVPENPAGTPVVNWPSASSRVMHGFATIEALPVALAAIQASVDSLVQDPSDMDNPESHPIVQCLRYVNAHPLP
jgi:hypothetical protein